jgi:2-oxoglutarate ferredoxin oxidoreductase subunit alpha
MFWIYGRPLEATLKWNEAKFGKRPELVAANAAALKAGHAYGETAEVFQHRYEVPPAPVEKGVYRNIGGNTATALGLIAASQQASVPIVLGAYPITPASDILHELSKYKQFGVQTIQAEDEIAAICTAIGAHAGNIGVTSTSGPAWYSRWRPSAVAVELPLVVIDIRAEARAPTSTKTEQADLLQAVYGRNSEAPVCVIAA